VTLRDLVEGALVVAEVAVAANSIIVVLVARG
jgi:hypothetical protein